MKNIACMVSMMVLLGLAGCSRTIDDVARWTESGDIENLIGALDDPKLAIRKGAIEGLGRLHAAQAIDALVAMLSDTREIACLAANSLGLIGDEKASAPLAEKFRTSSIERRLACGKALGHTGGPVAAEALVLALSDDNEKIRIVADESFSMIGDSAIPAIINGLESDQKAVRKWAAAELGRRKAAQAVDALAAALDDGAEEIACLAANSLGLIGDEKASAPLAKKFRTSSGSLRLACGKALGHTGGPVAAESLVPAMADDNAGIRSVAIASLSAIGKPSVPALLNALKDCHKAVRAGALSILGQTGSIPTAGDDLFWYRLARVSATGGKTFDMAVIGQLADMAHVETLLEVTSHGCPDFRRYACRALEELGEPCTVAAIATVTNVAGVEGLAWFNGRNAWKGAPSWRLDLWGAAAALNPDFKQARDDGSPSPKHIPRLIALLGGKNQEIANAKLIEAGSMAVYPLIATLGDPDPKVADFSAKILEKIGDDRAVLPLIEVLEQRITAGEPLSDSPLYSALQEFDAPVSEPLLLKIRPNTTRALRIFNRKYQGVRTTGIANFGDPDDPSRTALFRIGFVDGKKRGSLQVTFSKNDTGNWIPTPPLPDKLSS